jgi:hypothetical protein
VRGIPSANPRLISDGFDTTRDPNADIRLNDSRNTPDIINCEDLREVLFKNILILITTNI